MPPCMAASCLGHARMFYLPMHHTNFTLGAEHLRKCEHTERLALGVRVWASRGGKVRCTRSAFEFEFHTSVTGAISTSCSLRRLAAFRISAIEILL